MIISRHSLSQLPHRSALLPHHIAGRQYTRTGYGSRIPTRTMVQVPGSTRWRRVYVCQWSNAGTAYVRQGKDWIVIVD